MATARLSCWRRFQHRCLRWRRTAFGSPVKPAMLAGLIPQPERWTCGTPLGGSVLTALPPRLRATSIPCPLPAVLLASRTWRQARPRSIEPKTPDAGTRPGLIPKAAFGSAREWNTGNLEFVQPRIEDLDRPQASRRWRPHAYAVYVDGTDKVWVSDFGANAICRVSIPQSRGFETFPSDKRDAAVRQLNGRAGEVWVLESGADRLVVIRTTDR